MFPVWGGQAFLVYVLYFSVQRPSHGGHSVRVIKWLSSLSSSKSRAEPCDIKWAVKTQSEQCHNMGEFKALCEHIVGNSA